MWRLYTRWPNQRKFRPVNWRDGVQVGNLIYATLFNARDMETVQNDLMTCRERNPGMAWQWREVAD